MEQSLYNFVFVSNNHKLEITPHNPPEKHNLIQEIQHKGKAGLILFSSGTTGTPKVMLHDFSKMIDSYNSNVIKNINSLILLGFDHKDIDKL